MTIFRKNFASESLSGLKGKKPLLVHFFIAKEIITSMATKLFNSLQISFVY